MRAGAIAAACHEPGEIAGRAQFEQARALLTGDRDRLCEMRLARFSVAAAIGDQPLQTQQDRDGKHLLATLGDAKERSAISSASSTEPSASSASASMLCQVGI